MSRHKSIVGKLAGMLVDCVSRFGNEKGGLTMSKKMLVGLCVLAFGSAVAFAANPEDVSVTVAPVGAVVLSLSEASYDFGNLDVNTSSESAKAITITNTGSVGCTLQKQVASDGTWDITASSATEDGYDIFVATSASRPSIATFEAGDDEISNLTTYSNLTGVSESNQVTLGVSGTADVWFMIRMPKTISAATAQTIVVRFFGTGI